MPTAHPALDLPVAILAGGLGTRLGSLTQRIPKSLAPIHGRPFLAYQLDLLRARGIRRVVLCVGHLGQMIRDAFGDGQGHGVSLAYSFDGDRLLGTAGALRKARPLLGPSFFIMYGDSYLTVDFEEVRRAFVRLHQPALMAVYANDGRWDRSNVKFAGTQVLAHDKQHPTPDMRYIDYGLSVVSASVLEGAPSSTPYDLATLYADLANRGLLAGWEARERFYEIGSPSGLADFEQFIASQPPTAKQ